MHNYLKSVGFRWISNLKEEEELIADVLKNYDMKRVVEDHSHQLYVQISKNYAPGMGIMVCGHYDDENLFHMKYYVPYLAGSKTMECQQISIEEQSVGNSYLGACDDIRVGTTLIFSLLNIVDYIKFYRPDKLLKSITLSGLSSEAMILLPLDKKKERSDEDYLKKQSGLYQEASEGNEEAIESLTMEEIDAYTMIARRIQHEDIFTIVDTYFMPYGLESNLYHIMGDIEEYSLVQNEMTGERVWKMSLQSNGIPLEICINERDLTGEPRKGRRFKGIVWLQGIVDLKKE